MPSYYTPSYQKLSKHPRKFLALTGYTIEEFRALLPHFQTQFEHYVATKTLKGKLMQRSCR